VLRDLIAFFMEDMVAVKVRGDSGALYRGRHRPLKYYFDGFRKYAVFSGRATRSEYWYFVIVNYLVFLVLTTIAGTPNIFWRVGESAGFAAAHGAATAYWLFGFIPQYAVSVRRLHDTGSSGWWILIALLCLAIQTTTSFLPHQRWLLLVTLPGLITLFVFFVQNSEPGTNRFGTNPKSVNPVALELVQGAGSEGK
jgi:uncharacterized membrane protein YhaH (DUF805 family)